MKQLPEMDDGDMRLSSTGEDELKAFKAKLDNTEELKKPRVTRTITIPGFLYRDGLDRFIDEGHYLWVKSVLSEREIDKDLLRLHTITYGEGLKARDALHERIKPAEILGMVQSVWERGEVSAIQAGLSPKYGRNCTEIGADLSYSHGKVVEETAWTDGGIRVQEIYINQWETSYRHVDTRRQYKTGKWRFDEGPLEIARYSASIGVDFGNTQYPSVLPGDEGLPFRSYLDQTRPSFASKEEEEFYGYFADYYFQTSYPSNHQEFPSIPLPKKIWRRPDNLVISVHLAPWNNPGYGSISYHFAQSVSQQEVIDWFSQHLDIQKKAGQLPSQVEALEFAKIKELRKRGLFVE